MSPTATSIGSPDHPTKEGTEDGLEPLDERHFEAIYREYQPTLVRFAELRNADDPEAAADHALFEYHRAWHRLQNRDEKALRSYLLKATATQVIDQHRRRSRSVATEQLDDDLDGEPTPGFENGAVDSALLEELIAGLPPAQRETILQRFYLDLTAIEAGRLQGREANTIYQLQHRAVANLRKALLAGLAVLVIALVVWLARGAGPNQPVSTDPIDDEPRSIEQFEPEPPPSDNAIGRTEEGNVDSGLRSVDGFDRTPSEESDEQSAPVAQQTDEDPAVDQAAAGGGPPLPAAESEPVLANDPAPTPSTEPPPPAIAGGEPDPTTTTTQNAPVTTLPISSTTAPPPTTAAPPSVPVTQGFNQCVVFAVGSNRIVVSLHDPSVEIGGAAAYRSPSRIRLVNAVGTPVLEVETDGYGINGDTSGSVGWLDYTDGVQTHRNHTDTSPTEWGLLIDNSVPDDWRTVEYIDAQGAWVTAPTCNI